MPVTTPALATPYIHVTGVGDPGHDPGVGIDVRSANVLLRPDDDADLAGAAPLDALKLLLE